MSNITRIKITKLANKSVQLHYTSSENRNKTIAPHRGVS